MRDIIPVKVLEDNYVYLLKYEENKAALIDAGSSREVLEFIDKNNIELTHIFITHNHYDHTSGLSEIANRTDSAVVRGTEEREINQGSCSIRVISTPGHTSDSVCYYLQPSQKGSGVLFAGDTLFTGGCGRPTGSDPAILWDSLEKIMSLPDDTLICGGHDYREENYRFALSVIPENKEITRLLNELSRNYKNSGKDQISTLKKEKMTNIFLMAGEVSVKEVLGMKGRSAKEVFTELRRRKNMFC